ncbi:integrative conjugative element protein [Alcanivorax nanhaiticus]|jgi:RAQPRD family integrative conjugative element protein|uniref:Integrative conjugative element protein n=1 Tax=Alcanivorax nanhaiticus TaxID=1177154 RepID=A0A095SNC2_9GAMM|nr:MULTISPECIES: RAQPRD family integrative conjugative element protein [Gammaproteobacteria]KGD66141.1 integrative conjugative element protein [Alcanivorax nanhaiticus]MBM68714.1 conjugal transfer protein [Haliea sp.]|tara:strand:+ start:24991 stop:25293 length:303 start_codon:yes stop_codon:yes gene_type:complete
MKRHLWLPSFLIIGLVVTPAAFADADAEREALAKVIHEINALDSLIKRAEANAEQDSRIRFRYDWLRQDLKNIKDGIQSHIDSPRAQPRSFPPLRGDYRR